MSRLRVASWNVHWGRGRFRRHGASSFDVVDALATLGLLDVDVLVLAETFRSLDGFGATDRLSASGFAVEEVRFTTLALEPRPRTGPDGDGWWSLTLASRLPVLERHELRLPRVFHDQVPRRRALHCVLGADPGPIDVVAVHVSSKLWYGGPVRHLRGLRPQLPGPRRPGIVLGDCNLWGPAVRLLLPEWRRAVLGRTYPAHRPHSQIDHVLVNERVEVLDGQVLAPHVSDHRAVRATLRAR